MSEAAFIGSAALNLAFVVAALTTVAGLHAHVSHSPRSQALLRHGSLLLAALFGVASCALVHGLVGEDFVLRYVYEQSDRSEHLVYVLAAFWGGQAGSLLFWAATLSFFGVAMLRFHRNDGLPLALAQGLLAGSVLFFTALLLFHSDPFKTFTLIPPPSDGKGLNPQLQTWAMVAHPPTLLLGYVVTTVPFVLLVAALLARQPLEGPLLQAIRRWSLFAWLMLSIGLLLGMWWAYTELGWGGYWAWDPVENAAFIPWLTLTAFLHVNAVQERGGLRRWSSFLLMLSWLLTVFGTFLTRSGFISSIHAFARSDIGYYFLAFLGAVSLACALLLWQRWTFLAPRRHLALGELTRELALLAASLGLLVAAAIVLFGTTFPKLSQMATGDEVTLDASWFNQWMTPVALLLLLVTEAGMVLPWRRGAGAETRQRLRWPAAVGLLVGLAVPPLFDGVYAAELGATPCVQELVYAWLALGLAAAITTTVLLELAGSVRSRRAAMRQSSAAATSWGAAARAAMKVNPRRFGGYLVHLGTAWMILGFAGSAYRVETKLSLSPGASAEYAGYRYTLQGFDEQVARDKVELYAEVDVASASGPVTKLEPARFTYFASRMATGEVSLRSTPLEDLYLTVLDYDPQREMATILAVRSPLTLWVWLGGALMMLGSVLAMAWPVGGAARAKTSPQVQASPTTFESPPLDEDEARSMQAGASTLAADSSEPQAEVSA